MKFEKQTYLRLLQFVKPYKTRLIEGIVASIAVSAVTSLRIYILKPGLDKILETKNVNLLLTTGGILIALTILHGAFSYIQKYLLGWVGQNVTIDIRNKAYAHLQKLSLAFFITRPTGTILSRLTNDVSNVQSVVTTVPATILRDTLTCLTLLVLLFYFQWQWTLFMLIFSPLIFYPISVFARKIRKTASVAQEKIAQIYGLIAEKLNGIKIIKAFTQEEREIEKLAKANKTYFGEMMRLLRAQVLQRPVLEIVTYTISIVVIFFIIYSLSRGNVSPGIVAGYIAAFTQFYASVRSLADINKDIQVASASAERVFSILDEEITVGDIPEAIEFRSLEKGITFENVSFTYVPKEARKVAIKNINLEIKKGQTVAFVGPSGGGKTTCVNLIARFLDPTEGCVKFDGIDIKRFKISSLHRKIGIVTQDVILFNDTVAANIAYGKPEALQDEIIHAARLASADEFIRKLPKGYDTVIGERGATLSGGEAQRICFARALIVNPEIFILDEATSNLDTVSEKLIQDAFEKIRKGKTCIIVAHRLSTIKGADKIFVVEGGTIIEEGTHKELFEKEGTYRKLYDLSFYA